MNIKRGLATLAIAALSLTSLAACGSDTAQDEEKPDSLSFWYYEEDDAGQTQAWRRAAKAFEKGLSSASTPFSPWELKAAASEEGANVLLGVGEIASAIASGSPFSPSRTEGLPRKNTPSSATICLPVFFSK